MKESSAMVQETVPKAESGPKAISTKTVPVTRSKTVFKLRTTSVRYSNPVGYSPGPIGKSRSLTSG